MLQAKHINWQDCVEKDELIRRLLEYRSGRSTAADRRAGKEQVRESSATIGGLDTVLVDSAGMGAKGPAALVILCHGLGADNLDLVPLAREVVGATADLGGFRFAVPNGPVSMGYNPDTKRGMKAWFPFTPEDIQRAGVATPEEMNAYEPPGLPAASQQLAKLLQELRCRGRAAPLPMNKVILGGFSQGAITTTDLALSLPPEQAPPLGLDAGAPVPDRGLPGGLVLFSGSLLAKRRWEAALALHKRKSSSSRTLHVFQSHGEEDPMLPIGGGLALHSLLKDSGLRVHAEFDRFSGGHTIPHSAIRSFVQLCRRICA
eukprot:NODE_2080_length_1209_cov_11.850862_g1728_i0.p2 GENE.NODE_2080_length_1209_cov_11.850862_g1728_i0~~NODE_2080_length_1209_cov_11.850862_g1728_i0.p2  ORF type:complete len:353 (-),score=101.02 NODE_2080_length_1209_cov_11.850862_g1728_i0:149-1099(-)